MKELTKIEEILLVTIWRLKGDAYGVKIRKYVSNVIKKDFTYGHLYSALSQLTGKNLVIKEMGDPTPDKRGRRKIIYSLSKTGIEALQTSLEVNEVLWDGISKFSLSEQN